MKYRNTFVLGLLSLVFIMTSCGYYMKQRNNNNLKLLRKGMNKIEVKAVMGEPLVNEAYHQDDVWFYFTETKWSDGSITKDECTPLFFKDGKLLGWGKKEYKKFRQKDW